jgi:hypothetical protein
MRQDVVFSVKQGDIAFFDVKYLTVDEFSIHLCTNNKCRGFFANLSSGFSFFNHDPKSKIGIIHKKVMIERVMVQAYGLKHMST